MEKGADGREGSRGCLEDAGGSARHRTSGAHGDRSHSAAGEAVFSRQLARRFKTAGNTARPRLSFNLFFEGVPPATRDQLRDRCEAARRGKAISITAGGFQCLQGRIARRYSEYARRPCGPHAIVMRHSASGAPHFLARHMTIPIINAGDGTHGASDNRHYSMR